MNRLIVRSARQWGALLALAGTMLLGWPTSGCGAIVHDGGASNSNFGAPVSSLSANITTTVSGAVLYCEVGIASGSITVSTVATTGVSWSFVSRHVGNSMTIEFWKGTVTGTLSSASTTVTLSSGSGGWGFKVSGWDGADSANPFEAVSYQDQTNQGSPWTANVTTVTSGALVAAFFVMNNSQSGQTAGSGYGGSGIGANFFLTNISGVEEYANSTTSTPGSVSPTIGGISGTPSGTTVAISIKPAGATSSSHSLTLTGVGN